MWSKKFIVLYCLFFLLSACAPTYVVMQRSGYKVQLKGMKSKNSKGLLILQGDRLDFISPKMIKRIHIFHDRTQVKEGKVFFGASIWKIGGEYFPHDPSKMELDSIYQDSLVSDSTAYHVGSSAKTWIFSESQIQGTFEDQSLSYYMTEVRAIEQIIKKKKEKEVVKDTIPVDSTLQAE